MELRLLRYFVAVGEELHFARAARRLHIERSPLSRAIKTIEEEFGVQLLERHTRMARLTCPGKVLLTEARRVLQSIEQARASVAAAACGYRGRLRIALSEVFAQPRLATLFAQCRQQEPDVQISLSQTTVAEQLDGLVQGAFDVGFSMSSHTDNAIVTERAWTDPMVAVLPAGHPLVSQTSVSLGAAVRYPLVLCDATTCSGTAAQVDSMLRDAMVDTVATMRAPTLDMLLTLVSAGYGISFVHASAVSICQYAQVISRPLSDTSLSCTTYLLRSPREPSEQLQRFIARAQSDACVQAPSAA